MPTTKITWRQGDSELVHHADGARGRYTIEQYGRRYFLTGTHYDGLSILQIWPVDGMPFDSFIDAMRAADRIDNVIEGEASGS